MPESESSARDLAPAQAKAPHVLTAINAVMQALSSEGISKARSNEQQHYKFRGIDDIYNSLSGLLVQHNLVIIPTYDSREVVERETKNGGVLNYVTVRGTMTFTSTLDGSHVTSIFYGEAMDSADKATNKAMSAAFKYACLQVFCIPTEGDNDADATTHEPVGKSKPVASSKTPPPDPRKDVKLANADQIRQLSQFNSEPTGKKYVDKVLADKGVKTIAQLTEEHAGKAIEWINSKFDAAAEAAKKAQTENKA